MSTTIQIITTALLAFLGTLWIHPKVLKIAITKNLVDNPDARKLQRRPIPNMGGIAVFFGILVGICCSSSIFENSNAFMLIAAMLVMLYTGTIDDILGLSPTIRFAIEIFVICWVMFVNNASLNCFWGLWGVWDIPAWIAYPLTVFACVGIINAINLIDGVNGLSSGVCFMASVLFAIMFYYSEDYTMMTFAIAAAGAIIPFFLHNVIGNSTKMFIGDGGTLVMGIMMSMFVISIIDRGSYNQVLAIKGVGLVAFTVAVLAIPIFDTIRVMSTRILHHKSPFSPDKTHLHHMFIELGFSHFGTTLSILTLSSIIIASWFTAYKLGASAEVQLYIVILLGVASTFGFYNYAAMMLKRGGKGLEFLQHIGKRLQVEKKGIWITLQNIIDKL
ncbi:MAG: undecaprenyl/decaprenyl-phosphate alpha-N-acetylglucosaminyl 1-phosphate transferase [Bacteroidaceae bacterium]|nr:undecaprenyl/decaprenyl-phosphate alpha-N-acetylglucosaminyl 1-phosphate transferase [Bacteroidaceae bacterium]